ncbi:MAG: linear amide C-N hydrolase [Muribaculaceae bacterium]|nr:linear amide C-N hydrolase [Muribaculaceae bacterium]
MKKKSAFYVVGAILLSALTATDSNACTRVVYECEDMIATGRTMDWKEDPQTNLYIFPRGIERKGALSANTVSWKSKYGSVVAAGYDIGVCDGLNEAGLAANMLFLPESVYEKKNDDRAVMGISIWTQYLLDNFATVEDVVAELSKDEFRLDAPELPNGSKSTLHMAVSDKTGNNAIIEYLDGTVTIYDGRQYRVLTNSPAYNLQLAVNDYWKQVGGMNMLPGTNKSSDRFARASFYIEAVDQSPSAEKAVPVLMSVVRNVSVPYGISMPDNPYISSTRWRVIADQKNLVYYFENTVPMFLFHVDLKEIDLSEGSGERVLKLADGTVYHGDATAHFTKSAKPFSFLFMK